MIRQKALDFTIKSYKNWSRDLEEGNLFVFGDFNFRLDLSLFVQVKLFQLYKFC